MAVQHAGGTGHLAPLQRPQQAGRQRAAAHQQGDLLGCDGAGPEDGGLLARQVHHGGLQAHLRAAAVQDQRDQAVEVVPYMLGPGGAGSPGAVGAGRGHRQIHPF